MPRREVHRESARHPDLRRSWVHLPEGGVAPQRCTPETLVMHSQPIHSWVTSPAVVVAGACVGSDRIIICIRRVIIVAAADRALPLAHPLAKAPRRRERSLPGRR